MMINKHVPSILLVDSEPKWTQAVEAALEEQGKYHVVSVTDIETALHFPHDDGFDLILVNAVLAFGENVSKFEEIVRLYADKVLVISDVRSISAAIKVSNKMELDHAEKPFEPKRVVELVASRLQPAFKTAG